MAIVACKECGSLRTLSLFAAVLFLASCSSGGDPTSVAKTILENTCQQQSQGYLKVVNFVKTDAVSSKRDGVDYYSISYDMEVEGIKDGAPPAPPPVVKNGAAPPVENLADDDKPQTPVWVVLPVGNAFLQICQSNGKYAEVMSFEVRTKPNHGDCFVFTVEKGHRYKVQNNPRLKSLTLAKHESGWVVVQQ
jgi:hypothetical protein